MFQTAIATQDAKSSDQRVQKKHADRDALIHPPAGQECCLAGGGDGSRSQGSPWAGNSHASLSAGIGNQAMLRAFQHSPPAIQRRLEVNQPGDAYEQEADRVADQVMRMSAPVAVQRQCPTCEEEKLQRKCEQCEEEEKKMQHGETEAGPEFAPSIVHDVLNSSGQPLDPAARTFFEPRFRRDFSDVRIHADGQAAESARSVRAQAYTVGNHIAFGSGRFQPQSGAGRQLLAHELSHVVQQGGAVSSRVQRQGDPPPADGGNATNQPAATPAANPPATPTAATGLPEVGELSVTQDQAPTAWTSALNNDAYGTTSESQLLGCAVKFSTHVKVQPGHVGQLFFRQYVLHFSARVNSCGHGPYGVSKGPALDTQSIYNQPKTRADGTGPVNVNATEAAWVEMIDGDAPRIAEPWHCNFKKGDVVTMKTSFLFRLMVMWQPPQGAAVPLAHQEWLWGGRAGFSKLDDGTMWTYGVSDSWGPSMGGLVHKPGEEINTTDVISGRNMMQGMGPVDPF